MKRRYLRAGTSVPETGMLWRRARATGLVEGVIDVPECTSTNDLAREAVGAGAVRAVLARADTQTSGRGRRGARWRDVPGRCALTSLAWRADGLPLSEVPFVSLAGALATARVARDLGVAAGVKWPNDVWVSGRKLAGVLVETVTRSGLVELMVAGIGVNVLASPAVPAEDDLARAVPATSLAEGGWTRACLPREVSALLCEQLALLLTPERAPRRAAILAGARELHAFAGAGALVTVGAETYRAQTLEIGDEAELLVTLADGTRVRVTDSRASVRPLP